LEQRSVLIFLPPRREGEIEMDKSNQKKKLYYIQGVFFEDLGEIINTYDFCGVVGGDEKRGADFGRMKDLIGESKIFAFEISSEEVKFSKKYLDRDTFIHYHYSFCKESGWWEGRYVCHNGKQGKTRCFINETTDEFLQPTKKVDKISESKVKKDVCQKIYERGIVRPYTYGRVVSDSDFEERTSLIQIILDRIKPVPKCAPEDVQDAIDTERQMLVLRAGWNNMPIAELRKLIHPE
jgi:hypothetical protein